MSLPRRALLLSVLLLAGPLAQAQSTVPDAAMQQAQDRLRADQALCEKETTARGRLECRRDALEAFEASQSKSPATVGAPAPAAAASGAAAAAAAFQVVPGCAECGRITAIRPLNGSGGQETAARGPAGRLLEQRLRAHPRWAVEVQYPKSETALYVFPQEPGFKVGEAVRKDGSGIVRP